MKSYYEPGDQVSNSCGGTGESSLQANLIHKSQPFWNE